MHPVLKFLLLPLLALISSQGVNGLTSQCPSGCLGPVIIAKGPHGRLIRVDGAGSQDLRYLIDEIWRGPHKPTDRIVIGGHMFRVGRDLKKLLTSVIKKYPDLVETLPHMLVERGFYPVRTNNSKPISPAEVTQILLLLKKYPEHFTGILIWLLNKGVVFPDISKAFKHVTVNGARVPLTTIIRINFTVFLDGSSFHIPEDLHGLAAYLATHQDKFTFYLETLRHAGVEPLIDFNGMVTGIRMFDKEARINTPFHLVIVAHRRQFTAPGDLPRLLGEIQNDPIEFHKHLYLLEKLGAQIIKSDNGRITGLRLGGVQYPVTSVAPVKVILRGKTYVVPADLNDILASKDQTTRGSLLTQLQNLRVRLQVDKSSGFVYGVEMDGVPIPFPMAIILTITIGGRVYILPKDLRAIVKAIVELGPNRSPDLIVVLTELGVTFERNEQNVIIAIRFGDEVVHVPSETSITVTISNINFVLPRDFEKLGKMLVSGEITATEVIQVLQKAGFTVLHGADGKTLYVMRGFQVWIFPVRFDLKVILEGKEYVIPDDLAKIAQILGEMRTQEELDKALQALVQVGVQVVHEGGSIKLVFNGVSYPVTVSVKPTKAPERTKYTYKGEVFYIPDDLHRLVAAVTVDGFEAIAALIKSLQELGMLVETYPRGFIKVIVYEGQTFNFDEPGIKEEQDNVEVRIRGKLFLIPRDLDKISATFRDFKWGELVNALHAIGATLHVSSDDYFYGMTLKRRFYRFSVSFKIGIIIKGGTPPYMVPRQIKGLSQGLGTRHWDWKNVRHVLNLAGVEVQGGQSDGPVDKIGFEGTFYPVTPKSSGRR